MIQQPTNNIYQNLMMSPNSKQKLNRLILNILQGLNIKENQQKLNEMRKTNEYPLLLCQILADCIEMPFLAVNQLEDHKKSFVALEIKKISQRTCTDQCWRLMREVYYSELDKKVVSLIRQTCLLYHPSSPENNLLYIFLEIDLQYKGIKGVVRYLTFVHQLIRREFKELENRTMKDYGNNVVDKLIIIMGWDISEVVAEGVLAAVVLVYGLVGDLECWSNFLLWEGVIRGLLSRIGESSALVKCLSKYLMQEILSRERNYGESSEWQFNKNQLNEALHHCLSKTANPRLSIEQRFYFDCIEILSLYWVTNLRKFTSSQQLQDSQNMALDIIQTYSDEFTQREQEQGWRVQFPEDEEEKDNIDTDLNAKRLSFLKAVLYLYPQEQLLDMIETRTNYAIQIMQFSLHLTTLPRDNFLPITLLQNLLSNLEMTLTQQTDTYLFIKQKSTFIFTLLKYIAKFYHSFERELILRICYVVDFLVYKCDTITDEGFKMLDVLVEKIMDLEGFQLVEFLGITLRHINENEWLETYTCYFHAISILLNLSPQLVFERPSEHWQNCQFSQLQSQILIMAKKMVSILKKSFDYESMHKLNSLLQYLLHTQGRRMIQALRHDDELTWVAETNFKYGILTEQSCDIYAQFMLFSDDLPKLMESLEQYNFWKECDSQQLIFFASIYTKAIENRNDFFTSTSIEERVIRLKKNLWERYTMEIDDEEREKIVAMFAKNPKYFEDLCIGAYRVQKWSENRRKYWEKPEVRRGNHSQPHRENIDVEI